MKVKSLIQFLSGALLVASFSNAMADSTCPAPNDIRNLGSDFAFAYYLASTTSSGSAWVLVSQAYSWQGHDWQTIFTIKNLLGDVDPATAIQSGQIAFNSSPLLNTPTFSTNSDGTQTKCSYAPNGAQYDVVAVTPINFGMVKK